jgi:uncharacterized alpha-E superfamily protein
MLSRVADSFYWVGRYLERAEHSARVLNVHLSLALDDPTNTAGQSLLEGVGSPPPHFAALPPPAAAPTPGRVDPRHRAAVAGCVVGARENARQIREQVSAEMWEQLNRIYLIVRDAERSDASLDPGGAFLREVIEGAHLFNGVAEATLSHGEGWHYLQLGKYIERATVTAAMLETWFAEISDAPSERGRPSSRRDVEAIGLLRACASFEPYCRYYTAEIRPERIAEFLLLSADSPRSVRFAVDRVEDSLRAITRLLGRPPNGRPERYAGQLKAALNYGQIDEIMADSLVSYVQQINKRCEQVHAALYETYITYSIEKAIAR